MGSSTPVLETTNILLAGSAEWTGQLRTSLESAGVSSVETTSTIESTVENVSNRATDCIVTGYNLTDGTGIELTEAVRDITATLPVILCTDTGTETIASDAIGAGATDYIALRNDALKIDNELVDRIALAVREAQRTNSLRDRAQQFDAIFQDTQTATWVLDPNGTLQRANQTARKMVAADITDLTGEPFWTLPWWTRTSETQSDIHQVVQNVLDSGTTERIVTQPTGDTTTMLELTVNPVHDPRGDLVAVVVEGTDVTERVSLYRELHESEELHRVTLNNMTDTILITDESGAFTYICPNVHFIFGYSVEEIEGLGTIDKLLGEDLFDREELADEGVLTNIECRATDKAGNEHVLLVNVREVDIQDGTLLFSCRDITKRKQREEALTTLQDTTRRIQYAETKEEVATLLVEDAGNILDLPAGLIALHETDDNTLRTVAYSGQMETLHGPFSPIPADEESLAGYSFVNNYPRFYDDVRDADQLADRTTDLRSGAFIPIGDHGLYIAGSPDVGAFDKIRRELTGLIAATAEAAFDRVERDSRLRTQDRKLQRQNQQLEQLNDLNELIRDIDRALVSAETRAEVDQTVCEALTNSRHFSFAWIGELDQTGDCIEPNAWAGEDQSYLDAIQPTVDPTDSEPSGRTAHTQDVTVVSNIAEGVRTEEWQRAALQRGYQSAISVPLLYDEFLYGVLTVYADGPGMFDDRVQETLAELGETIASAISALNRKNALLTASGTRLEFDTKDPRFPLLQLARRANCSVIFDGGVQQTDEGIALFVSVDESATDALLTEAQEMVGVTDVQVLNRGESESLLRLELSQSFVAQSLADHGAVLRRVVASPDGADLVVDVPANNESAPIIQHVLESLDDTEFVAKYTEDRTPTHELYSTFLDRVTDRQLEVLKTAYYSGFFESPREQSGEEIAATLGISPPAFYQHARTVQRKLFATLFDEIGVPAAATAQN